MTAHTPLEQALIAWSHNKTESDPLDPSGNRAKQVAVDDAAMLGECGIFSNRNIALITGLEPDFVGEITGKKDKTGGRFNPEALPLIYDLRLQWSLARVVSHGDVRTIVELGVSPGMLAKLTGISRTAIYSWAGEES